MNAPSAFFLTVLLLAAPATYAQTNERALLDAGIATTEQLREINRAQALRIQEMESSFREQLKELEYEIEQLTNRIGDIERSRELDERQKARESLSRRRSLNWPKVNSGMTRRQVLRLVGSGVPDKSETSRDCRCYSQGKICFDANDLATKSSVRCQL